MFPSDLHIQQLGQMYMFLRTDKLNFLHTPGTPFRLSESQLLECAFEWGTPKNNICNTVHVPRTSARDLQAVRLSPTGGMPSRLQFVSTPLEPELPGLREGRRIPLLSPNQSALKRVKSSDWFSFFRFTRHGPKSNVSFSVLGPQAEVAQETTSRRRMMELKHNPLVAESSFRPLTGFRVLHERFRAAHLVAWQKWNPFPAANLDTATWESAAAVAL